MKSKIYFLVPLIAILIFINNEIAGQVTKGSISGYVFDKKKPVEFATIILRLESKPEKIISQTTSDSIGHFMFSNIILSKYIIQVNVVGYNQYKKEIDISASKIHIDLGEIYLEQDNQELASITVTAKKNNIQKTENGFIFNANTNIAQVGGTAADILKGIPTISVDAEGIVTLRGKSPLFLINGRNSNISATDQIPASSIEKIEIINNASAKYDANAESGIINIILKKNKQNGTNGAVGIGGGWGSRGRFSSSAIINHQYKKWNFGVSYDNRFAGRTKNIVVNRTNLNLAENYNIIQDRNDERIERLQNVKLNVDFARNAKNVFSFEAIGSIEGQDNEEMLLSTIRKSNSLFNKANNRQSFEYRRPKVGELSFNYDKKFNNPKKYFSVNLSSSFINSRENTNINTQALDENKTNLGAPIIERTHNYENGVISNVRIDYGVPLSLNSMLEFGYKGIFRKLTNDYETAELITNNFIVNPNNSNIFTFNENVHAFYSLLHSEVIQKNTRKFNYEIGARVEIINNKGINNDLSANFTNKYWKLFPNASLKWNTTDNSFLRLSYSKRINRPSFGQLNPFVDITDALNPHSGNPSLMPEIIDAGEISYNKRINNNLNFTSSIFYRYSSNIIRTFYYLQPSGVSLYRPENVGSAQSYGIENILSAKPASFFDVNASLTFLQIKMNASNLSNDATQNAFNWYGKIVNNFTITSRDNLQIIGSYNSKETTPQGNLNPIYFFDLGYQRKIGKGNSRLGISIIDIFNSLQSGYFNSTNLFISNKYQKADTRAIMISYAYTFKSSFKEKLMDNKFSKEF